MGLSLQRSDVGEFRRRYRWLLLVVVTTFLWLLGRLAQLQLLEGDMHRAQARRNIVRERWLATTRGVIRDAHGRVVAANRPSYNVHVTPSKLDLKETWPQVAKVLRLDEQDRLQIEKKFLALSALDPDDKRRNQQILLKVDVDRDIVAYFETRDREFDGVEVTPAAVRYYPYGALGAQLFGYMQEVDAEALVRLEQRGYRPGDRIGAVGVERRWESYLRGQRGFRKVVRSLARRENLAELEEKYLDEPRRVEPIPGREISLTVDIDLMASIERAMQEKLAGAVAILEVRTGRILAALSKPSFNPNLVSGGSGAKETAETFRRLNGDSLHPMLDKTVSAAYPPGSTYKPFTALAALADHLVEPETNLECHGGYQYGNRFFRCTGVHRRVNLHRALVRSCNSYFYDLGARISIDRLASIGMDFGFGSKTGVGINPEARGRMPTRGWYARRYKTAFRGGFTLLSAIGQGATTVSVLQLALAYAALANGGTLYQPQVVRSVETSDGTIVQEFPPRVRRTIKVDPEQLGLIRKGLEGAVTEPDGTANQGRIPGVDLAGKTGTAQVTQSSRELDPEKIWYFNRPHAWFAAYAPSHAPEIAIVVLVEHGGGGGKNAVPVAMRVVSDWQKIRENPLSTQTLDRSLVHADPGGTRGSVR